MCKKLIWFCAVALILAASTPSWSIIVRDDFSVARNYLVNGPAGIWDGVIGKNPPAAGEAAKQINTGDPNSNRLRRLFLASSHTATSVTSWEDADAFPMTDPPARYRGPFLYKNVQSDYWLMQVRVIPEQSRSIAWNMFGLMARAKLSPCNDGSTIDQAGTGEDTEELAYFPTPSGTYIQALNDGVETEAGTGGLRPYLRMSVDTNAQGPRFYFDTSIDGANWQRQNSPRPQNRFEGS